MRNTDCGKSPCLLTEHLQQKENELKLDLEGAESKEEWEKGHKFEREQRGVWESLEGGQKREKRCNYIQNKRNTHITQTHTHTHCYSSEVR